MTPAEAEALGRRWLAAGGGWRDGMLCVRPRSSWRVLNAASWPTEGEQWPDLRDPATRGAAMEVVRERWGDPAVYVVREGDRWYAAKRDSDYVWEGDTIIGEGGSEAEALAAALEAAPERPR